MNSLNLYGPLNEFGYGIFTRGVIKGLLGLQRTDFQLCPIGPINVENTDEATMYNSMSQKPTWNRSAPSVSIWHEFDLNKFSSNKLIAYPIFETTKFNPTAINYLKQMDSICTLSEWGKSVITENIGNDVPITVVQGASDSVVAPNTVQKSNSFTFFHAGKYEQRKSSVEAMISYIKAFENKQADTRFVCHCFNPFDRNFVNNTCGMLNKIGMRVIPSTSGHSIVGIKGNAIIEIPRTRITREQLFMLMQSSHAGIFPSRAEGWNLPLMEAIKVGVPSIATNYSAHTEYLTEEYGYPKELLLNNLTPEIANDGQFFHGDRGHWMKPDLDEIAERMLYIHDNYQEILKSFNPTKIVEHFTWENTATQLLEVVSSLND